MRPRRPDCAPPAIEQFPPPLMSANIRKVCSFLSLFYLFFFFPLIIHEWIIFLQHGGIIIHILVAIFTFLGLAIVCDDYFVSSLDRICEELKLTPDVAGATYVY